MYTQHISCRELAVIVSLPVIITLHQPLAETIAARGVSDTIPGRYCNSPQQYVTPDVTLRVEICSLRGERRRHTGLKLDAFLLSRSETCSPSVSVIRRRRGGTRPKKTRAAVSSR